MEVAISNVNTPVGNSALLSLNKLCTKLSALPNK